MELMQDALDGRSLKKETLERVNNPAYVGESKVVNGVKYLMDLPNKIGEEDARKFIESFVMSRIFGWQNNADVAYLIVNHADNIYDAFREINKTALSIISDSDIRQNKGADTVNLKLLELIGKRTGDGIFGTSKKKAKTDTQVAETVFANKIKNTIKDKLKTINVDSLTPANKQGVRAINFCLTCATTDAIWLRKVLDATEKISFVK